MPHKSNFERYAVATLSADQITNGIDILVQGYREARDEMLKNEDWFRAERALKIFRSKPDSPEHAQVMKRAQEIHDKRCSRETPAGQEFLHNMDVQKAKELIYKQRFVYLPKGQLSGYCLD